MFRGGVFSGHGVYIYLVASYTQLQDRCYLAYKHFYNALSHFNF